EFFLMAEPPRLILDIPDTHIGEVQPDQSYDGVVQNIRVAQHTPEHLRIVIELAPDIVLAPEQADIQFDDRNGQRHWRFRPLLAADTVADTTSPAMPSEPSLASETDVSLSAANLAIAAPSATTILPIDPYDSRASNQVVSVPPLDTEPHRSGTTSIESASTQDLPPMTVPVLEQPTDETLALLEPTSATSAAPPASLPDLTADQALKPVVSATFQEGVSNAGSAEDAAAPGEPASAAEISKPENSAEAILPVEPQVAAVAEITSVAVAPSTERPEALKSPVEMAEAQDLADDSELWETIQQPAAERTIVKIEMPAPLTFGQPLPGVAD
ncbi:MAG: AMIN domain-containing protein, partial [Symploca sp. SIO2G7]|nr:AMIN domain-containing protein [Symploca sp. SIO2G7]